MMVWFHFAPDWRLLFLPLFMALALGVAFGIGLWFCSLNVEYRDFRYIIPFIVQFGVFRLSGGIHHQPRARNIELAQLRHSCPTVLLVESAWSAIIDGFRWALLRGQRTLNGQGLSTARSPLCARSVLSRNLVFPPDGKDFRRRYLNARN